LQIEHRLPGLAQSIFRVLSDMAIILTSIFNGQDNAKAKKGKNQKTLKRERNKKINERQKKIPAHKCPQINAQNVCKWLAQKKELQIFQFVTP
jgi:hypothetical protein